MREGYLKRLTGTGSLTVEMAEQMAVDRRQRLQDDPGRGARDQARAARTRCERQRVLGPVWKDYMGGPEPGGPPVADRRAPRAACVEILEQTGDRAGRTSRPTARSSACSTSGGPWPRGEQPLDWAAAEALAFGTLAREGHPVRLSGQDSQRGTFSHRHSVLHDARDGDTYAPAAAPGAGPGAGRDHQQPAVRGGGAGLRVRLQPDLPRGAGHVGGPVRRLLNVAQAIIDQFIASAEGKWGMLSGLVLLLPHGFEGMGPEHSSARLERFLQLAAEDNLQIANPTTPAQMFHLLRRQVWRHWRKPLVVMTPKSLLRHPECVSALDDLAEGVFQPVLPDPARTRSGAGRAGAPVQRQGLLRPGGRSAKRLERDDVAILRLEQPYPLPASALVGRPRSLPGRRRPGLGPGGAGQHGRLALPALPLRRASAGPPAAGRLPSRGRQPGHRFGGQPQAGTLSAAGRVFGPVDDLGSESPSLERRPRKERSDADRSDRARSGRIHHRGRGLRLAEAAGRRRGPGRTR